MLTAARRHPCIFRKVLQPWKHKALMACHSGVDMDEASSSMEHQSQAEGNLETRQASLNPA